MIFRIIDDATGAIVMSLDYPDPTIPTLYLKPGQTLFSGEEFYVDDGRVRMVDGRLERLHHGPVLSELAGVGEIPVPIIFDHGGPDGQEQ